MENESRLISYFRQHIAYRIIPRVFDEGNMSGMLQPTIRDVFEVEAARFLPVSHVVRH